MKIIHTLSSIDTDMPFLTTIILSPFYSCSLGWASHTKGRLHWRPSPRAAYSSTQSSHRPTAASTPSSLRANLQGERSVFIITLFTFGFHIYMIHSHVLPVHFPFCIHKKNEVPSLLSITYNTIHPWPRKETELPATV